MMRANGFTRNRATRRAACPLAYGGSANATSYCPECSCSANLRASTRWTTVRSSTLRSVMLALSDDNASRWISTKSALTAARERFETERTRAREQVEHPRAAQWALEDGEPRLAHAVSGGPDRVPRGRLQTTTLELAGDYPDHRLPSSPPFPFSRARRHRRHPRLQRRAPLPLVALQPERHVQPLREPMSGDRVGPLERDRREDPRRVVQSEAQVVRAHAPGADGAGLSHAEHRRRIARTARLEVADQLLQLVAHEAQRQLQVDPLGGHQVVGAQKLARDGEKRNTEC